MTPHELAVLQAAYVSWQVTSYDGDGDVTYIRAVRDGCTIIADSADALRRSIIDHEVGKVSFG
jgi:hypothetical protein